MATSMIGLRVGAIVVLLRFVLLLLLLPAVWVVRCIGAGVCWLWLVHGVHCLGAAVWAALQGGSFTVKHRMHIPQPGPRLVTRPKGVLKHLSLQYKKDSVGAARTMG